MSGKDKQLCENIANLENHFSGERIFLIGNGPSLSDTPLDLLKEEYTFALNKINKIYNGTQWRPKFYFNSIGGPVNENIELTKENIDLGVNCFIDGEYKQHFENRENLYTISDFIGITHELDSYSVNELYELNLSVLDKYWSDDVSDKLYSFHSMYALIQISIYMGFDKIYLLGCDLGYGNPNPHMTFYDTPNPLDYDDISAYMCEGYSEGKLSKSILNWMNYIILDSPAYKYYASVLSRLGILNADSDHFTDEYEDSIKMERYRPGNDTNRQMKKSHIVSNKMAKERNVEIYNTTIGGELEVYPRKELKEVI